MLSLIIFIALILFSILMQSLMLEYKLLYPIFYLLIFLFLMTILFFRQLFSFFNYIFIKIIRLTSPLMIPFVLFDADVINEPNTIDAYFALTNFCLEFITKKIITSINNLSSLSLILFLIFVNTF